MFVNPKQGVEVARVGSSIGEQNMVPPLGEIFPILFLHPAEIDTRLYRYGMSDMILGGKGIGEHCELTAAARLWEKPLWANSQPDRA